MDSNWLERFTASTESANKCQKVDDLVTAPRPIETYIESRRIGVSSTVFRRLYSLFSVLLNFTDKMAVMIECRGQRFLTFASCTGSWSNWK